MAWDGLSLVYHWCHLTVVKIIKSMGINSKTQWEMDNLYRALSQWLYSDPIIVPEPLPTPSFLKTSLAENKKRPGDCREQETAGGLY